MGRALGYQPGRCGAVLGRPSWKVSGPSAAGEAQTDPIDSIGEIAWPSTLIPILSQI